MRQPFTGVGTAIVTPFTKAGALDEPGVRRLVRRQIDEGVHFLVPCGTTGESPTLSEEERTRIVEICVEEARGKVPVLAAVRRGLRRHPGPAAGDGWRVAARCWRAPGGTTRKR